MATENDIRSTLSFFLARKLRSFVLAGLMAWSLPGTLAAEVESGTAIATNPPIVTSATAGGALMKTGLSDSGASAGKAAPGLGAVQYASVAVGMSAGQIAAAGGPQVHIPLSDPQRRGGRPYPAAAMSPGHDAVPDHSLPSREERELAESGKDEHAVLNQKDESSQLPYALVLALFALIGLVPVSRRGY